MSIQFYKYVFLFAVTFHGYFLKIVQYFNKFLQIITSFSLLEPAVHKSHYIGPALYTTPDRVSKFANEPCPRRSSPQESRCDRTSIIVAVLISRHWASNRRRVQADGIRKSDAHGGTSSFPFETLRVPVIPVAIVSVRFDHRACTRSRKAVSPIPMAREPIRECKLHATAEALEEIPRCRVRQSIVEEKRSGEPNGCDRRQTTADLDDQPDRPLFRRDSLNWNSILPESVWNGAKHGGNAV